jgi:hypothetical protein
MIVQKKEIVLAKVQHLSAKTRLEADPRRPVKQQDIDKLIWVEYNREANFTKQKKEGAATSP